MKKNLLIIGILTMCLWLLTGCLNDIPYKQDNTYSEYNTVFYDTAMYWMTDDYVNENMTRNTTIIPESESAPETITYIIKTQSDFDYAFEEFPIEVDFDKDIIVVHFFTGEIIVSLRDGYRIFTYRIKDIKVENEEINIAFGKRKLVIGPTGSPPTQECLVIKMDKVDAKKANVEVTYG